MLTLAGPSGARVFAPLLLGARHGLASAAGRVVIGGMDGGVGDEGSAKKPRRRLPRKAALELTESAAQRISELLQSRQERGEAASAVRIGVRTRGCNGLSYTMNYATEPEKLEEVVEQHGARIFVEPKALMHVVGTTMDFVEDDTRT